MSWSMRVVVLLVLVCCVPPDDTDPGYYDPATGDAWTDLGDSEGVVSDAFDVLCALPDSWNCDMASANIDKVVVECTSDQYDLWSSYLDGVLYVCPYDPVTRPGGLPPVLWVQASALAHEAGHGRPRANLHVVCQLGYFAGSRMCDNDLLGALYAEVHALEAMNDPSARTHLDATLDLIEL